MPKYKNVAFSEGMWERMKVRSFAERVTLREVCERACHQYLESVKTPEDRAREVREAERAAFRVSGLDRMQASIPEGQHWEPDDAPLAESVCRRCGHREGAHSRGAQGACGQMGCACARFRSGDE